MTHYAHLPLSTNLMLHTPYLYAWLLSCLWWGRPRVLSPAYSNSRIPGNILCRMKRTQKSRVCSLNPPKSEFFCDRLRIPHPSPCSCLWLTTRKFALVSSLLHLPLSTNLMLHTPCLYAWLLSCLWWGRPRVLSPAYSNSRIPGNILCRMKRTQKSRVCSLNPPKSEFFCDRLRVPHPSPWSCLWLTTRTCPCPRTWCYIRLTSTPDFSLVFGEVVLGFCLPLTQTVGFPETSCVEWKGLRNPGFAA